MVNKHHVKLTVPAISDYIAVVRLAIAGIAARMNFSVDEIEDIKVAVSEACTNAVRHAYQGGAEAATTEDILIECQIEDNEIVIIVSDKGKGFDTKNPVSPSQINDSPIGLGLGLTFIRSLMDSVEVKSAPGQGCSVIMTKKMVIANTGQL